MPFHICKKSFPSTTVDQLAATKDAKINLKTHNHTTITQLGRCKIKIQNNNTHKACIFLVVPGDGEALLGMPYIELLNILNINCNTVGAEKAEKGMNCYAKKDSTIGVGSEQCYAYTGPKKELYKDEWLTVMRLNIFFQAQAERVTEKQTLK